MTQAKIPGGYYIKSRKIQQSQVAHASPCVREMWDWILLNANYSETRENGHILERGQLATSFKAIQEGLSWNVGFRKEMYSKDSIASAMKWLKKAGMVAASKTTRGLIITVLNYSFYQNPSNYKNYDNRTENRDDNRNKTTPLFIEERKEGKSIGFSIPKIEHGVDPFGNLI